MNEEKFQRLCDEIEFRFPSISEFIPKIRNKDISDFDRLEFILSRSMYGRNEFPQYEKEGIAHCQNLMYAINNKKLLDSMYNLFFMFK